MGVPKGQSARNRQAIIEAASRVFRERGIDGIGVADLMREAGFTHGGFYNHFESKEALAAEAVRSTFASASAALAEMSRTDPGGFDEAFRKLTEAYLSSASRDNPRNACPTATLALDSARACGTIQTAYAEGIEAYLSVFTSACGQKDDDPAAARARAIDMLSGMVGALVLARAVAKADPRLSDEILAVGRDRLPKPSEE